MKNYAVFIPFMFLLSSCDPKPITEAITVVDTTPNLDSVRTIVITKKPKLAGYQGTYKGT